MKEALGGISLFQIVIVFILLFTGIICLTINQSKAFAVKDEIITIIQNQNIDSFSNGSDYKLTDDTSQNIAVRLKDAGYRTTGNCPSGEWIGYSRDGVEVSNNAAFCIRVNNVSSTFYSDLENKCTADKCIITSEDYPSMVYYDIVLFYELDIPILKYFMNFKIYGSTKVLFG
ncbi:MAG: hypothetical protein E7161_00290 [Firmicutes bacterium]|nr:hypothetical protein [Bacillota bacterium]